MTVTEELLRLIERAVDALKSSGTLPRDIEPQLELSRPANQEHGDFYTNLPLTMARHAKLPPAQLARELSASLPGSKLIKKVEVAGPGFLNFYLSDGWLQSVVGEILKAGDRYGRAEPSGEKVQIEFVSANPTGPLHVGSGRNAAYGDALGRLLEAAGWEVAREFYVNDAGNQIKRFTESLRARYLQALGRKAEFPEGGYEGDFLIDLGRELASQVGEEWIDRPEEIRRFGLERATGDHRRTLERFGVRFDNWFSEQSLHDSGKVQAALEKLRENGYLYEKDGATWFAATDLGAPRDQVVVRSGEEGAPTYLGVDAAYLLDKLERGFDRVIYVWGADHHGNAAGLNSVARALGVDERLEILLHQMVTFRSEGSAVRMSRRLGTIVTLDELLDEVGRDAARFTFLSRSIDMTIDFDLEVAKSESPENPVFYVQYQHARACSVLRQAGGQTPGGAVPLDLLTHSSEIALLKKLAEYPELVAESARLRAPHRLSHFTQATGAAFSAFYRDCRVLSEDAALTAARLYLVDACRQVLANSLGLLGVSAPDHMAPRAEEELVPDA